VPIVSLVLQAATLLAGLVTLVAVTRQLRSYLDPLAWNLMMSKFLRAGDWRRAVLLCKAALATGLVRRRMPQVDLTLSLIALDLPTVDDAPRDTPGYRAAERGRSFEDRAGEQAKAELGRQQRLARRTALRVAIPGALAAGIGLASAVVQEQQTWRRSTVIFAAIAAIAAAWSLRVWQRQREGLTSLAEALVPLLRPREDLDEESRNAQAEAARLAGQVSTASDRPE
jgi:hypothetical protein